MSGWSLAMSFLTGIAGALLPLAIYFVKQYANHILLNQKVKSLHERVDDLETRERRREETVQWLRNREEYRAEAPPPPQAVPSPIAVRRYDVTSKFHTRPSTEPPKTRLKKDEDDET